MNNYLHRIHGTETAKTVDYTAILSSLNSAIALAQSASEKKRLMEEYSKQIELAKINANSAAQLQQYQLKQQQLQLELAKLQQYTPTTVSNTVLYVGLGVIAILGTVLIIKRKRK